MEHEYLVYIKTKDGDIFYVGSVDDWDTCEVEWEEDEDFAGLFTEDEANQLCLSWFAYMKKVR